MLIYNMTGPKVCPSGSKGQIQVIFGPMFSGKTTELIRRLKRYQIANHRCLIVKYAHDTRYTANGIATHDSFWEECLTVGEYLHVNKQYGRIDAEEQTLSAVSTTELSSLKNEADTYSVIGIDEGQFFPDIIAFSEEMANKGKVVIVAALDGTYQRKGFGDILQLVPLAESVIKLTAVCMFCFEEASYTKRIVKETEVEVIGGTDKYMAVCRNCYEIEIPEKQQQKNDENAASEIPSVTAT